MTYVKTYLPTLKTHVVNLKRDAKDMSRDLQRLEVRGKLGSKTLYSLSSTPPRPASAPDKRERPLCFSPDHSFDYSAFLAYLKSTGCFVV